MATESLQDSDLKTYKNCENPCKYELLVIFTNYKDLFTKVHYAAFLTYPKNRNKVDIHNLWKILPQIDI